MSDLWDVWRVDYRLCSEVDPLNEIKPVRVAERLRFENAKALEAQLGFGHCIKPHEGNDRE